MRYTSHFRRRTKIVCTIGPTTGTDRAVRQMIKAGMDVARLNLAHGTYSEHSRYISTVRKEAELLSRPVAIVLDLPGPKYRTGSLKSASVALRKGNKVVLTTRRIVGDGNLVPVDYPSLPRDVRAGDTILLGDSGIRLGVRSTADRDVECKVLSGGVLTPGRGIVIPGIADSGPFITSQMEKHLDFAVGQRPDYVALSFVSRPSDINETKTQLRRRQAGIPIIAKIERRQAVLDFDQILAMSDAVMVARGDLGLDIPLERVPLVQKELIRKCNQAGKPVITATQMLESMITSPRPTRAEVTDVANAVFDGTDAVMLSAETSIGAYPIQAVRVMDRIARAAERCLPYESNLAAKGAWLRRGTSDMIGYGACYTAQSLGAVAVVAFTESGSTARRVSQYRPNMPVIAITPVREVLGALVLSWGVLPVEIAGPSSVDELFDMGAQVAKKLGLAKAGDLIVITGGIPVGMSGTTNLLKVHRVE